MSDNEMKMLSDYLEYLSRPAKISDIAQIIRKFGKEINNDFTFAILTQAVFLDNKTPKDFLSLTLGDLIKRAKKANISLFCNNSEKEGKCLEIAKTLRNFVHPGKRLRNQIALTEDDYKFLFLVFSEIKDNFFPQW